MTDKPSSSKKSCTRGSCRPWKFVAALLLLRLCLGVHFFSEGTKKLAYDEGRQEWGLNPEFVAKTEAVFRNATGPFADLLKSRIPGFYDWEKLLAVPNRSEPLSDEEIAKRRVWQKDYASRRAKAKKEKKPEPIEFPEYAPYKAWGEKIVAGWSDKLKAFTELSAIGDEQDALAAERFVYRHQQLVDTLEEESQSIEDYQHELWRLQKREATGGADEIPFRIQRLSAKRTETVGLGKKIVAQFRSIETRFNSDLRSLLTAEQRQDRSLSTDFESSITSKKERELHCLNVLVTCFIIAIGACLLLGLFTRLAALGGILFLLSVMVTQLPWVPGAKSLFFYYQLAECASLLVLMMARPWKVPGLDCLIRGLCSKCCGTKK